MLKLKLQYFGYLMRRVDSLEKTLMLGGIGGRRRRGWQRMRWLDGITDSMGMSLSELRRWWLTGRPGVLWFMGSQRVGHDCVTELNWTYRFESQTIKKSECQGIDAFKLWCWRRLFRVPWTARKSNQSILKEINPEYSLEELMLKLQYFGHLMWRVDSPEMTVILGKTEDKRKRGRQRMRWLYGITDSMDMSLSNLGR